jgi:hypothetical protein
VAGARPLELGAAAHAHEGVARLVLDLPPLGLVHPSAQRLIRRNAFGLAEGLRQAGEHCRCERDRFACGDVSGQQGVRTPGGIPRQPAPAGMAMDPQQARRVVARRRLPTRQQVQQLEAGLCVAIECMSQACFERGDLFMNRWDGVAHRGPSRQAPLTSPDDSKLMHSAVLPRTTACRVPLALNKRGIGQQALRRPGRVVGGSNPPRSRLTRVAERHPCARPFPLVAVDGVNMG